MQEEIINFTKQLVSIPSQNHIDTEENMSKAVVEKLRSFDFKPEVIGPKEHPSVICFVEKPNAKKVIWLEAMLDTVPIGDEAKWDQPPLEGCIVGNKMYGRGVADSKVAIALFSYLAKELYNDPNFEASVFLGFDADEQTGNFTGIKEVMQCVPKADICILGYQGMDEISIGARGWLRLKITTLGKSAHTGSRSKKGVNAIHAMAKVIEMVTVLDFGDKVEPFFEFGSSLHFSQIQGGEAINVVPDKCEVKVDIRLLPTQTKDEILSKIKSVLGSSENIKYEIEELQGETAYLTDSKNAFVQILKTKASETLGREIPLVASGQGSVGNIISKMGIPIINAFGCESDNVHAPNEWINIDTIPLVFKIYKETLLDFASGKR